MTQIPAEPAPTYLDASEGWQDLADRGSNHRNQSTPSHTRHSDSLPHTPIPESPISLDIKPTEPAATEQSTSIVDAPVDVSPRRLFGLSRQDVETLVSTFVRAATESALDSIAAWIEGLRHRFTVFLFVSGIPFLLVLALSIISPGNICSVPGACISPAANTTPPGQILRADFPALMKTGQTLEVLLEQTARGPSFASQVKEAEMATSDLAIIVRYSNLTSRARLSSILDQFVIDAHRTGAGLRVFGSQFGSAVNSIQAVSDFALNKIDAARADANSSPMRYLPFSSSFYTDPTQAAIISTFKDALSVMSTHLRRLIHQAQASQEDLDLLEQHLLAVKDIIAREIAGWSYTGSEIESALWTMIGGNQRTLQKVSEQLDLLKSVSEYRTEARALIVGVREILEQMIEDLEELRRLVSTPELVGESIPVDVQLQSLRSGVDGLDAGRTRARGYVIRRQAIQAE